MTDLKDHANHGPKDSQKVSPILQLFLAVFAGILLALAFNLRIKEFKTSDEPLSYETVTPQKLREFGGAPQYVDVGLHIDRFQTFDLIKNEFEFTGSLWFEFESGATSIETLSNFQFARGTILDMSEPDTSLHGTRLRVRYLIRVKFNSGLNYRDFPFDDHRVNLVITHPFLSPEEIIFDTRVTNFIYAGHLLNFGWNPKGKYVKSGFIEASLSELSNEKPLQQPVVGFTIDVERYGARYVIAILLPILLIYFLMFFIFSMETHQSIGIALGGITGILAYRYVIETLSPLSGDMMLSDQFFFLILTSSMLIFVLNAIDLFLVPLPLFFKKLGIVFIHLFTLAASIYLLVS